MNITHQIAALEKRTVDQLRTRYTEVFGEATNCRHRAWLVKRIAWRLQANAEGDLSERARRRAAELANDADLRTKAPRSGAPPVAVTKRTKLPARRDARLPMPGSVLTRTYKGGTVEVTVLADGFEYDGQSFRTLSAVTKHVTGKHWNGYHFFGLAEREVAK